MAGQRLTDKTALTEQLASDDLLMCVDTSDTTGSSVGTSKKIENKYVISTDIKTGNLNFGSSPMTLVAAPGTGYFIQPITITILFTYGTVPSSATGYAYIGYDSSTTASYITRQRDFYRLVTNDQAYVFSPADALGSDGTYDGDIEDKDLFLYGMNITGDSTFKVYTTYQIVQK